MAGVVGRPGRRPDTLLAGRGYGHDKYRREAFLGLATCLITHRHVQRLR
ncbi:hypothetical protein [Streptomyces sp. NPDC018045]